MMEMDKDIKVKLLQNKGAVIGTVWAELCMIGYSILYPQIGGYHTSLLYKAVFLFVLIIDKIEGAISPGFSFHYTLAYTYRANTPLFIFILGIGGVMGGFIGVCAEFFIKNTPDYINKHQEPTIKEVKGVIKKLHEGVVLTIKNARERIQKYQKKKGE